MPAQLRFALNHIVTPRLGFRDFARLAGSLDVHEVEIRNDLKGVALMDGTAAADIRTEAEAAGVRILSINALQRFNDWDERRALEAVELADYARDCGAEALVLCPVNARDDRRDARRRNDDLREALAALAPILAVRGLVGLVEPLGFEESSLRLKREALDAIDAMGGGPFALLHDTFHHFLSGEREIFPDRTGLVHVSGVEDWDLPQAEIRDGHRVLVGRADLLGSCEQIRDLIAGGYRGAFSFEPFAEQVHGMANVAEALRESMALIRAEAAS
jgi:2-keto-myo-inositol isomerase